MSEKPINLVTDIRDLAREAIAPQTAEKVHYAIIPEGSKVVSLKEQQYPHGLPPERISQNVALQNAASFCSYVNSFKDHRTRLFANADAGKLGFLAVLDYHPANDGAPQFLSHRASFPLKHSEEWLLWLAKNDKPIPQVEFAEFLEDNRADIVRPDSATMLEVARDLQAHTEVNFASKINSHNGSATLTFDEQVKAQVSTGQIVIPENFVIRIPVFFGEQAIDIHARLRFRVTGGELKFQFKLNRPAEVISRAFDTVRAEIADATTLEVLLGMI